MKLFFQLALLVLATTFVVDAKWDDSSDDDSSDDCSGRDCDSSSSSKTSYDYLLECEGHVGTVYGDPHLITFDEGTWSCQAQGEFVMVNSEDKIQIQSKFEYVSNGAASITTGIAIAQPGIDTVQVSFAEYDSGDDTTIDIMSYCPIHLYIDGELEKASVRDTITGDGYEITISTSSVSIQFYDGTTPTSAVQLVPVYSRNVGCYFTAYICLPASDQDLLDNVVGLLGTPNGDTSDDWMTETGETLTMSSKSDEEFDYCTTYHCVYTESDSLFVHEDSNGGMSFDDLEACNEEYSGGVDTSEVDEEILEICGDNEACILEGVVGGVEAAQNAISVQNTTTTIHSSNTTVETTSTDPSCPGDITLLQTTGDTAYESIPLSIVNQTTDSVTLKVTSAFSQVDILYIEYEEDFVSKCISTEDVTSTYSEEIHVSCPGSQHVALVSVVVSDGDLDADLDTADAAVCCHADDDTNPKVKYTFLVNCVSQCPDVETVRAMRRKRILMDKSG